MSRLAALVWKDVLVHRRTSLLLALAMPVWVRLVLLLLAKEGAVGPASTTRPHAASVATLSVLLMTTLGTVIASALVDRERSKETFAWLRTLPVSDWHIVGAKFVTLTTLYVVTGTFWWLLLGRLGPALSVRQFVTAWLLFQMVGSVALASSFAFSGRWGSAAPPLLVLVVLLAAKPTADSPEQLARVVELWHTPSAHVWAWLVWLVTEFALVSAAYAAFHRRDSPRVVD